MYVSLSGTSEQRTLGVTTSTTTMQLPYLYHKHNRTTGPPRGVPAMSMWYRRYEPYVKNSHAACRCHTESQKNSRQTPGDQSPDADRPVVGRRGKPALQQIENAHRIGMPEVQDTAAR